MTFMTHLRMYMILYMPYWMQAGNHPALDLLPGLDQPRPADQRPAQRCGRDERPGHLRPVQAALELGPRDLQPVLIGL
jgi:hypothetical protein